MAQFDSWCSWLDGKVGNHHRRVMTGQAAKLDAGVKRPRRSSPATTRRRSTWRARSPASANLQPRHSSEVSFRRPRRSGPATSAKSTQQNGSMPAQRRLSRPHQAPALEGPPQHGDARRRRHRHPVGRQDAAVAIPPQDGGQEPRQPHRQGARRSKGRLGQGRRDSRRRTHSRSFRSACSE